MISMITMIHRSKSPWSLVALSILLGALLTGCSAVPSYSVRVENLSSKAVLAQLERRPSMNQSIVMDSARVDGESEKVLGPMEAPPLERVYIVIKSPDNVHSLPESHKIRRGNWVVTISDGSISSWGLYEISVRKE